MVRQHRRTGGTLVVAAAMAGLLTGTAGCAGDDAAAEPPPVPEPLDAVHRAAAELVRAGTSKARTAMEMATGGTRVTIRGEGVYDYGRRVGRLKLVLPPGPTGTTRRPPITELLAPGALYMRNRGAGVPADKWVRVDTASVSDGNLVTGGATDPLAAAELLRGARTVTYEGPGRVAGTAVRHYRGTTDLARAARFSSGDTRRALAAAAKGFSTTAVPFDVYLDERGRVRKVRHRFSFVNDHREGAVAVASTTLLFAFGVPVEVRLPAEGDIYAGRIADEA